MWKWQCVHENYTDTLAVCTVRWWSVVVVYYVKVEDIDIYMTQLAHVVVSPIATCVSGVFPSTQWRRYQAYARATCTVWWCFWVVVVDAYVYVVAVVVAMGCWCWENVLVLVKENIS